MAGGAGAQVLFRRLPLGFSIAYIPKGPIGSDWAELLVEVDAICRKNRAVLLKVEPDGWVEAETEAARQLKGFHAGGIPIQPRRTISVNLSGSEETILDRMKQKTRYNIRLAERKGVTIRPSTDLEGFNSLMKVTAKRDGFGKHSFEYYRCVYNLFKPKGMVELLLAEYAGNPLAALMVFARGIRSWYFYGASNDMERNRMPTYLLQWEAMRWARKKGCIEYDLWGVPDEEEFVLEDQFETRHDGLWGVYRFKRGFGGTLQRSQQTWEKVYNPPLYSIYRRYAGQRGE